ncbi:hypothetical protein [Halorubrum sp. DTA98]|uniref:hypothetical protein n=1 Tax=Halorubrum sp. DTA98 TaxID=3402163 RepID=UPI003AAF23B2
MTQPIKHLVTALDDPRISRSDFRHLPATDDDGRVTLVGVVHDHPASVFRVVETVAALDPDVVALEIAPIAVPLFRRYAREHGSDPELIASAFHDGGEMSAAISAAGDARAVGIDLPNSSVLRTTIDSVRTESLSVHGAVRAGYAFGIQTLHAVQCRISHAASRIGIDVDPGLDARRDTYTRTASPDDQAVEEDDAVAAGTTLLRAFSRPPAMEAFDRAREAAMADELCTHRRDGADVVAVVGYAHLDPIAERLGDDRSRS